MQTLHNEGKKCPGEKGDWNIGDDYERDVCDHHCIKKNLKQNIILPTLNYGCETYTWYTADSSRIQAVEKCY